jgi:hypothetical protein
MAAESKQGDREGKGGAAAVSDPLTAGIKRSLTDTPIPLRTETGHHAVNIS